MYSYYLITFNFFSSSAQSFLLGEKIYTEFRTVFWRFFLVFLYFLFVVGRHVRRWIGAPFCLGSCLVRRTEKLIQFTFFCFVPSPTKPASCSCPWAKFDKLTRDKADKAVIRCILLRRRETELRSGVNNVRWSTKSLLRRSTSLTLQTLYWGV